MTLPTDAEATAARAAELASAGLEWPCRPDRDDRSDTATTWRRSHSIDVPTDPSVRHPHAIPPCIHGRVDAERHVDAHTDGEEAATVDRSAQRDDVPDARVVKRPREATRQGATALA